MKEYLRSLIRDHHARIDDATFDAIFEAAQTMVNHPDITTREVREIAVSKHKTLPRARYVP